jgi:hypothetical protein
MFRKVIQRITYITENCNFCLLLPVRKIVHAIPLKNFADAYAHVSRIISLNALKKYKMKLYFNFLLFL